MEDMGLSGVRYLARFLLRFNVFPSSTAIKLDYR